MKRKYFHGTTLENFISILKKGKLICNRKKKVWSDYSEDAVYLMPEATEDCDRYEMFELTGEQASFALYQYDHTKRVILEIEMEENLFLEDKDTIYGVKIYSDIDVSNITNVFIEKEDNSEELKKLIAITLLFRDDNYNKYLNSLRYNDYPSRNIYNGYGIKHIKKIPLNAIYDEEELKMMYMDLLDTVDHGVEFIELSIDECYNKFITNRKEPKHNKQELTEFKHASPSL